MLRARHLLNRARHIKHRSIIPMNSFEINGRVWFHCHRLGWRFCTILSTNLATILVENNRKLYPTHNTRIYPYFGELSIPPILKDCKLIYNRTDPEPSKDMLLRVAIYDLLNPMFVSTHVPQPNLLLFSIPGTSFTVYISMLDTCHIDYDYVFLTVTKISKDPTALHEADRKVFDVSKREEIDFLLKEAVSPIPLELFPTDLELKVLKWILAVKASSKK